MDEAVEVVVRPVHIPIIPFLRKHWKMADGIPGRSGSESCSDHQELDERVRKTVKDESTYIIDAQDRVHMAHMDIHYGFSVNGVAPPHRDSEKLRTEKFL